jgi:hypothetical protein
VAITEAGTFDAFDDQAANNRADAIRFTSRDLAHEGSDAFRQANGEKRAM